MTVLDELRDWLGGFRKHPWFTLAAATILILGSAAWAFSSGYLAELGRRRAAGAQADVASSSPLKTGPVKSPCSDPIDLKKRESFDPPHPFYAEAFIYGTRATIAPPKLAPGKQFRFRVIATVAIENMDFEPPPTHYTASGRGNLRDIELEWVPELLIKIMATQPIDFVCVDRLKSDG